MSASSWSRGVAGLAWRVVGARLRPLVLGWPLVSCSADAVVTLGRAAPNPIFGDGGRAVRAINGTADEDHPTLTQDLLEIYFTSRRAGRGNGDVWCARRRARADAFDPPELVREVSSAAEEASPAISRDGLTLWFGSDRPGGLGEMDIWQAERGSRDVAWGALRNVSELNSASDDIPRPPAESERVMPFASRRDDADYQTYLAVRPSRDALFQDIDAVEELWQAGSAMLGGFLTEDGLLLFFHRERAMDGDLYLAWRRSARDAFQGVIPLDAMDESADQRDPWVNIDRTRFFFASDRHTGTGLDILGTTLDLPRFE